MKQWQPNQAPGKYRPAALGVAFGLMSVVASPAGAQLLDPLISPNIGGFANDAGVTVISRERSDYEAGGIRAGSFVIRPRLTAGGGYESNVLGTARPRGSPFIETSGGVEAVSDVSRVNLAASLAVDDVRYLDEPRQSFTNWAARIGGSYDVGRDVVSLRYEHLNLNQTARDLDVAQQLDQTIQFSIDRAQLSYRANFNRVFLTPAFEVSSYAYSNGSAGNVNYRQDYRDRVVLSPSLTAGYELSPRRNVIAVVREASASYSNQLPGVASRDFDDIAVLGGIDYDATGLVRLRALVGYEVRLFKSAQYRTIQAPIAELAAIWTPTGLTTLTAGVTRRIQDSADETTAGYTETSARLRVDHEYLRNVLLQANAGVYFNEYRDGGDQRLYTFGAGVTYLLNRNIGISATYDIQGRQSGSDNRGVRINGQTLGGDYISNRGLLQIRFGL